MAGESQLGPSGPVRSGPVEHRHTHRPRHPRSATRSFRQLHLRGVHSIAEWRSRETELDLCEVRYGLRRSQHPSTQKNSLLVTHRKLRSLPCKPVTRHIEKTNRLYRMQGSCPGAALGSWSESAQALSSPGLGKRSPHQRPPPCPAALDRQHRARTPECHGARAPRDWGLDTIAKGSSLYGVDDEVDPSHLR